MTEQATQQPQAPARVPAKMGERGFDFDFESAWRFAKGLIEGGMVPYGIKGPGAVVGLMEAGKELGLPPMYALANLTFTNGRLGIMGDAAKALVRRAGVLEPGTDFTETYTGTEGTADWTCTVTAQRRGNAPCSRSFSLGDAMRAGLVQLDARGEAPVIKSRHRGGWGTEGPWSTYTARMLMYRATGFLVRDYFSDVLGGAVLTEELRDYPGDPEVPGEPRVVSPPTEPDPLLAEPSATLTRETPNAEIVDDAQQPSLDLGGADAEEVRS